MKKILFFLILIISLSSCSHEFYCKRCPLEPTVLHTIEIKDSITIKELLKDTTITVYLPADSVINVVKVVCDSAGLAQLAETIIKTNNMIVRLKIENGVLTQNITHLADSLVFVIQTKEITIEKLREINENLQKTEVKTEKYVPKFIKILAWIGGIVSALFILLVGAMIFGVLSGQRIFFRPRSG